MLSKNRSLSLDLTKSNQKSRIDKRFILIVLVTFIVTAILCTLIFVTRNDWGTLSGLDASNYQNLKTSLRELIDIRDSGDPTVIEVSNAENLKLQDSVLYTQVENNDLMLVFKDKVIIYRPLTNKIVNIFPVNN